MNVLETQRLVLRQLELNDADFILNLLNEPAFLRFIGDKGVRSQADAREYISLGPMDSYARCGFGMYLTSLRSGVPIGICGLIKRDSLADVDLGFALSQNYCSHGYATESATAVLEYARRVLQLPRIVAITAPENVRSIAVLEKIGLRFEHTIELGEHGVELKLFGTV